MLQTLLYYKYVHLNDAEELVNTHHNFCQEIGIKGRILIADEGLNGTVSGTKEQCATYMDFIESDERFKGIQWKIDNVKEISFTKLHIRYKSEIVHSGMQGLVDPTKETGIHLTPTEFKAMKDNEDVIILDARSNYEHKLGKFKNAVTLDIDNFREYPEKVVKVLEEHKGKKILTYCTGGIKCEKASAYLLKNGFEDVYQLHGGIINYGKEVGGEDFDGNCYVFDGRVQVPVNTVNPSILSTCKNCGHKTNRMVNCSNPQCNDHFVQCENCGKTLEGACSVQCKIAPNARPYNAKGYYLKQSNHLPSTKPHKLTKRKELINQI